MGTRLAIKEPYFKRFTDVNCGIRVDNPSDVIFLPGADAAAGPSLEAAAGGSRRQLAGSQPGSAEEQQPSLEEALASSDAGELRQRGNALFRQVPRPEASAGGGGPLCICWHATQQATRDWHPASSLEPLHQPARTPSSTPPGACVQAEGVRRRAAVLPALPGAGT